MQLKLGLKSDPVLYRYSYDWLFRLMRDEGVTRLQLGTFFEMYQLPDTWFVDLRAKAADHGIVVASIFTAHRELGGFFRTGEAGWEQVARRNFERLIEIGSLVGAQSVGSNPGAVLRDSMCHKATGIATYLRHFRELQRYAADHGLAWLNIEPMSCIAEPPTLPREMQDFMNEVLEPTADQRVARAGYCLDIAHGYADLHGEVIASPWELMQAALPHTSELHIKNTDKKFDKTFGFLPAEVKQGIVDLPAIRTWLMERAADLPVEELNCYLEIGGPKLGRDYSDDRLEEQLRGSLQYVREHLIAEPVAASVRPHEIALATVPAPEARIWIEPSVMCVDLCNLETEVRTLEALGVDALHFDIMDAHFVPNMPLGLECLGKLRQCTSLPIDAHLMVDDPAFFIPKLAKAGAGYISIHAESTAHLDRVLALIRDHGAKAGLALNPATPLSILEYVMDRLDFVLLMTVNPGFAGQALVPSAMYKIAACRRLLDASGRKLPLQVDGCVSFQHIPDMVAAGADWLIAGSSSLFHRDANRRTNVSRMRQGIHEGVARRSLPAPQEARAS